jgi:hypothetical protein
MRLKAFSPHDCRRSYVTALPASGASIAVVQKLAGHASVNTTARYDRSDEDAKRKVRSCFTSRLSVERASPVRGAWPPWLDARGRDSSGHSGR